MSYLQQGFSRHSDSVKSSQNPSPFPLHISIKIRLEVNYGMLFQMIKLCHFKLDFKPILMFINDVERAICWSSCTITELSWDGGARVWSHCWLALCTHLVIYELFDHKYLTLLWGMRSSKGQTSPLSNLQQPWRRHSCSEKPWFSQTHSPFPFIDRIKVIKFFLIMYNMIALRELHSYTA